MSQRGSDFLKNNLEWTVTFPCSSWCLWNLIKCVVKPTQPNERLSAERLLCQRSSCTSWPVDQPLWETKRREMPEKYWCKWLTGSSCAVYIDIWQTGRYVAEKTDVLLIRTWQALCFIASSCAHMHHHHRPHWSRTFLLNHSLCINSLVLTIMVITRGAVMVKYCWLPRYLRNYIIILYQQNIPYYHVKRWLQVLVFFFPFHCSVSVIVPSDSLYISSNLYQECNLYLKIIQVNWQIACKGNHFFLRILLAERLLSQL